MQGLKKRRRIQIAVTAACCFFSATALIGYGFRDGIEYFRLPADVFAENPDPEELFRLGGLVGEGSVIKIGNQVKFNVIDEQNTIRVEFEGILPDLFAEGQGVIVLGRYKDQLFTAVEVLAKHDEKYMPKEVADALKEQNLFRTPDD